MSIQSNLGKLARRYTNVLVVAPSGVMLLLFVYGFVFWSFLISLTNSRIVPVYEFVGLQQYELLWSNGRWLESIFNLAVFLFLFVAFATFIGLLQAILLDQNIRSENAIRTVFLYPMAISFIVTGVAWKWMLNPGLGIQRLVRDWGYESFEFDWIVDPEMALFTLVIAAVWQSSGFAMALFLASLRSIDDEILKAAKIDGASTFQTYRSIVMPLLRPALFTTVIILVSLALRTFDLMVAMTGGGPGFSSDLPTNFFYQFAFGRSRLGFAAASGIMIFVMVVIVMAPFIYSELRNESRRGGR
ncbi:MAG: sugar ABC transporter permease [Roseitalea sp.]|jgi:glucose/mannose transport system permease protein|nr:sugar ABC transporter permease [Roseitalea sp.]MBO6721133.1 sugar ABC transporter permease [Roseitalea sp.]MBO6744191.1 sugar ABC transporter permease [Roseitalea sp.]